MAKRKPITVKVTAVIEVQFDPYENETLNDKAKDQIRIWVEESLQETDQIPLFISSSSGEETISKTVKVTSNE